MKKSGKNGLPFDVNQLIADALYDQRLSTVELSRRLNVANQSVHYILNANDVHVGRLYTICKATGVNIFRQIASSVELNYPEDPKQVELQGEIDRLKREVEDLKKEREMLRNFISVTKG